MSKIRKSTICPMRMLLLSVILLLNVSHLEAQNYNHRYGWPALKAPSGLIVCPEPDSFEEVMLLESLSGLAAQAVNQDKFNEMVWIDTDKTSYKRIFQESIRALNIKNIKLMDVWELASYLKKKHIVKGYVLYSKDNSKGKKMNDYSSNVATIYASLMNGALIGTSLEGKAREIGLQMLKDARNEDVATCFRKNKDKLNNSTALSIRTNVHNLRDYAIAHRIMLFADETELKDEILEWVEPLSPIIGWGCGDEYETTRIISEWGHYNTASNWCINLPFISAAAPYIPIQKAHEMGLDEIDFSDSSYVHSFVMSDGDNMQWTIGNFADNDRYAGNDRVKETGVSWTLCPINLSVVSPVSWNTLTEKQGEKNSFIEYGGGYQYPDLFAIKRPNRPELLRAFAKRINEHMKEMNLHIFGALFEDVDSQEAQEAMQIYAEELEDLTGMIAIQYYPYELGKQTYWFKNKDGIDIPMVTADFSLWNSVDKKRPYCGTPEYVSSLINKECKSKQSYYSWTIVHAWSNFAETSKVTRHPAIGMNPIIATESLLMDKIRTVSLNELLWRLRMKERPQQTESLMGR